MAPRSRRQNAPLTACAEVETDRHGDSIAHPGTHGAITERQISAAHRCVIGTLAMLAACDFPRPADVEDEAPGLSVQVSSAGDDANDGVALPVKTLRRAIEIAGGDPEVKRIVLGSARYSTASGEIFPYTVPPNVTLMGAASGGTVLVGTGAQPGLTVDLGKVQDLELENFAVAIEVTGTANIKNARVRDSALAMRGTTTAKLTVDDLDITGTIGACGAGIVLNGAADLVATNVATRNLGITLDARDQSAASIAKANVAGDPGCKSSVLLITTSATFTISDSIVDGGWMGLTLAPSASSSLQATVRNTSLRHFAINGITGTSTTFVMTNGDISNTEGDGARLSEGSWTFENVTMKQNGRGVSAEGISPQAPSNLRMRGTSITEELYAIYLTDWVTADLGTSNSPGNNHLLSNSRVALRIEGTKDPKRIDAVGNTWRPNVQGADPEGRYTFPAGPVAGPILLEVQNNYAITSGYSLQLAP